MKIRKMQNVSNVQIPVELLNGTIVYLPPREIMENVEIKNYEAILKLIRAEVEISEPVEARTPTIKKIGKRQRLDG